jgi:hypothetical protein
MIFPKSDIPDINNLLCSTNEGNNYLALIPLRLITFHQWSQTKYNIINDRLAQTGAVSPIVLGDIVENNKYSVTDGLHRCCVCYNNGYTHIPTIVSNRIINREFIVQIDQQWTPKSLKNKYETYSRNNQLAQFWYEYDKIMVNWDQKMRILNKHIYSTGCLNGLNLKLIKWYQNQYELYTKNELTMVQNHDIECIHYAINNVDQNK